MAELSTLTTLASDFGDLVDKGSKVAITAATAASAMYEERVRSIAEKARKSVMMYKVIMSAGIRDAQLAGYITKYFENMYAIFTLVTLGYSPTATDNSGLNAIVDSVSAESFNENGVDASIAKRALSVEMLYVNDAVANKGPRIGKNAKSVEEWSSTDNDYTNRSDHGGFQIKNSKGGGIMVDFGQSDVTKSKRTDMDDESKYKVSELQFIDNVAKNNLRAYPTIVNMKVSVNRKEVAIPIAVKANAYPVGTEELRLLIESGIAGKPSAFLRKMKWRSGEISTLAYIFNTDIAERDKKLYAKLGRNPWYQELQKRKQASNASFWARVFTKVGKEMGGNSSLDGGKYMDSAMKDVAELSGYKGDVPPTATLVCTKEDLVAATRLDISHFTKNDGFIKKFMKDSFLLGFSIVDTTTEQVTTFFLGYEQPFIISFEDLKKEIADPNKALYEAMRDLARKA